MAAPKALGAHLAHGEARRAKRIRNGNPDKGSVGNHEKKLTCKVSLASFHTASKLGPRSTRS